MATFKKILIAIIVPILLVGFLADIWFIMYKAFGWDEHYTLTTNYVDKLNLVSETEEKYFIEAEYFSNENKNGIENFGLMLNYYTDVSMPELDEEGNFITDKYYYSSGIQFKNGFEFSDKIKDSGSYFNQKYVHNLIPEDCIYYNIDNQADTAFTATKSLANQNKWIYDINGQLCKIATTKKPEYVSTDSFLFQKTKHYRSMDINFAMYRIFNSVKSLDDGEYVLTFDLSDFFEIVLYNKETQKFDIKATTQDEWTFVKVLVKKSSDGLITSSQSMFNSYLGDSDWSYYNNEKIEDFWKGQVIYNIKADEYETVMVDNLTLLKLKNKTIKYLNSFSNIRIIANIDLDNLYIDNTKVNINGFADNAFGDLEIYEVNLQTTNITTFYTYDKTLNINCPDNLSIEFLEVVNE